MNSNVSSRSPPVRVILISFETSFYLKEPLYFKPFRSAVVMGERVRAVIKEMYKLICENKDYFCSSGSGTP